MESSYLATALAAGSKGRTQKGESIEKINGSTHDETGEEKDPAEDADMLEDGHYAAAREMMDCMHSGDHEGMAKAMHSFVKMSK